MNTFNLLLELITEEKKKKQQLPDEMIDSKEHIHSIARMLFKQKAGWVKDLKRSKEAKYIGVVHTDSTLKGANDKPLKLTFDNSTDSGEFEINSLAPLKIKKGSELDDQIKKLYKEYEVTSKKKTNYIVKDDEAVLREVHLGKYPSEQTVKLVSALLDLIKDSQKE